MKRILIFSLSYFPHIGGAEIAMKEITDRIAHKDIEFHMITLRFGNEPSRETVGNIIVHRIGDGSSYLGKVFFIPRAARVAARLHRADPFDAFWAMMSYMVFPIVLLRLRGIRPPYLLSLQEGDPFKHVFNRSYILPFRSLLHSGFKNASAVQAISSFLAGWAKQEGFQGTPDVIPNGVDVRLFSRPIDKEKRYLFRASIMDPNGTLLVTTSRLVKKNAVDVVIRALVLLPASVKFLIIGSGPDERELKNLAQRLRIESRIEFIGYKNNASLPFYLHSSDIFIRPSRSEGMGNSFIEAMAIGIPIIGTQEGGIRDFLCDARRDPGKETTGWAVDPDSPEQIAEAVQDILAHPDKTAQVTLVAKKLVSEKYDWNSIAMNMQILFEKICN